MKLDKNKQSYGNLLREQNLKEANGYCHWQCGIYQNKLSYYKEIKDLANVGRLTLKEPHKVKKILSDLNAGERLDSAKKETLGSDPYAHQSNDSSRSGLG